MTNLKKLLSLVLAVLMTSFVVGCGSSGSNDPVTDPANGEVGEVSFLTLSATETSLQVDDTSTLTISAINTDNEVIDVASIVTWQYDQQGVAVSGNQLTARQAGSYSLQASFDGVDSNTLFFVISPKDNNPSDREMSGLSLAPSNVAPLQVNDSVFLTATAQYDDNTSGNASNVAWASSNPGVASVSNNGRVSALSQGTTVITATSGGFFDTVSITVEDQIIDPPPVEDGLVIRATIPSDWTTLYVYSWGGVDGAVYGEWPGTEITERDGQYYKFTVDPGAIDSATNAPHFVFNNGDNVKQSVNVEDVTASAFVTISDELSDDKNIVTWVESNPVAIAGSVSPRSRNFTGDSLSVTITASGMPSVNGSYTLDGSAPTLLNGTPFSSSATFDIGATVSPGTSITLRVYVTNGTDDLTFQEVYNKTEAAPPVPKKYSHLRIYQVMVEAFQDGNSGANMGTAWGPSHHNGDIKGITNSLDYIKSLNMNAIWLTPIFVTSNSDRRLDGTGYFASNYFDIDPRFGSWDEARELVEEAHKRGIYVIFDGVFGHHTTTGSVATSPNGNNVDSDRENARYPGSLEFYKEVAAFWIDELGIDGWRLDVAKEVPKEYWDDIRGAAEDACQRREDAGEDWGTLCYMVAEVIPEADLVVDGEGVYGARYINHYVHGEDDSEGLLSSFHFPGRYPILWAYAAEEFGGNGFGADVNNFAKRLNWSYEELSRYPAHVEPNLFLSNHDFVRFGDLLQRGGYGNPNEPRYWARYRGAYAFLASQTGPMTVLYNEEIGAEVENFAAMVTSNCGEIHRCDDHVARISGRVSDFSNDENAFKTYFTKLMKLRSEHMAMSSGVRTNLVLDDNKYADLKVYEDDRVVVALNGDESSTSITFDAVEVGGTTLVDLFSGEQISASGGTFTIPLESLGSRLFEVQ